MTASSTAQRDRAFLFALALVASGCLRTAPLPHLPSDEPSRSAPLPAIEQPSVSPSDLAREHIRAGQQRLERLAGLHSESGYTLLLEMEDQLEGLIESATLAELEGLSSIQPRHGHFSDDEDSALYQDYITVRRAANYRHMSPPIEIPTEGAVTIANRLRFLQVSTALRLLPRLELANDDLEDQIQNYFIYLKLARTLCLDAPTIEQYEQGISLEQQTLTDLTTLIKERSKSAPLDPSELSTIISNLQMLPGSDKELLGVLDSEYFMATRRLEALDLHDPVLTQQQDALAERILALRRLFVEPDRHQSSHPHPDELIELDPAIGWPLEKDSFLSTLHRSRLAATGLAALEVRAALELHSSKEGAYPNDLEQLQPTCLPQLPVDRLTSGGRFIYHKTEDGFVLQSIVTDYDNGSDEVIIW